jgi:tetratricopeptide (TPR) repeat protein
VTAARVVAHFASVDRDSKAAEALFALVSEIVPDGLDEDAQGQLALTRGMLLWLAGNTPASYHVVQSTVDALRQKGTENIVAVQLLTGLGTLRMHQGEYQRALTHYFMASEMAARLGNDTQIAAILGNLAVCYGRLGDYNEQLRLSLSAPQPWGGEFGGFVEVQLTYCQALALVMLGRQDEAFQAMTRLDRRLQGVFPHWMTQAWLLWKADLLLCAGKEIEASLVAAKAVHGFGFKLQSPAFAGPFARWLGYFGRSETDRTRALQSIQTLLTRSGNYDALDEVEMMCAALSLKAAGGAQAEAFRSAISERLKLLPTEVTSHLRRLRSLT